VNIILRKPISKKGETGLCVIKEKIHKGKFRQTFRILHRAPLESSLRAISWAGRTPP
jgi:hypothetical protein